MTAVHPRHSQFLAHQTFKMANPLYYELLRAS
jgi:hypothetical protein